MNELTPERHKALLELQSGLTTLIGVLARRGEPETTIGPRRQQLDRVNRLIADGDTPRPSEKPPLSFADVYHGPADEKDRGPVEIVPFPVAMLTPPIIKAGGPLIEKLVDEQWEGLCL